jgi:hypothetical protein
LPARYATGVVKVVTVRYHTWGSRQCIVNVSYDDPTVGGPVHTCVGREEVGEVPGEAMGDFTVMATPFGIRLMRFETRDLDKRNKWGRPQS